MMKKNGLAVFSALLVVAGSANASVTIDPLFSDNAVLQRGVEIPVGGTGTPGRGVTVGFAGQTVETKVGNDGRWVVRLAPMRESAEGRILTAESSGERLAVTNVLVGEVFLCSGQSNMQQPLWCGGWGSGFSDRKGVLESKIADWPNFRYTAVRSNRKAAGGISVDWQAAVGERRSRRISALSYYFASTLLRAEPSVPVGIVNTAVGGSAIEPWLEGGKLFASLVSPLGGYPFRAVLWYQGESNVGRAGKYTAQLHELARSWRKSLGNPTLPFIVSEIAPFRYASGRSMLGFWRAQQRFADEDANAVCVPINDCGDLGTPHPDRKELPALRYAAVALNRFYGRKDIPCAIPRAVRATADAGGAIVEFENVRTLGVNSYLKYVKHEIPGFELCGADGEWKEAKAAVDGRHIRVFSSGVPSPVKVRYLGGRVLEGEVYSADSNFVPSAFELDVDASTIDAQMQRKCQEVCDWAVREGLQGSLQFCAYRDGKCIVDVWAGSMATNAGAAKIDGATLFPIFSTEKPLLAAAAHRAVEKKRMDYDKPISAWWKEWKGGGKEKLTLGQALAYRAGMNPGFPKGISGIDDRCDWKRICALAAKESPVAVPGTVQKYLSMSYAWIIGRPLECAYRKPLNEILLEEVLRPCAIEDEFYFAADDDAVRRTATVYGSAVFEMMNDERLRRMCMPSAYAVANARSLARFYNRLCGFDGRRGLLARATLEKALKPSRHESDPLPPAEKLKKDWHMIFGMGFGLWGEPSDISNVIGHGGVGGSEGLVDMSKKLTVGFTCNFGKDVRKVRSKLYGIVGMKWRYWDDAEADIQEIQMTSRTADGNVPEAASPVTFANPLDLDYRVRPEKNMNFREGADPEIVVWKNRYWLFASKCGGYYVSDDLATWKFIPTGDLPLEEYAPTVWVMDGEMYFSSRGGTVHRAVDAAAGKWEKLRLRVPFTLDSKMFFENGRLYNYWGGTTNKVPLWVRELDPDTFRCIGKEVAVCEMDDGRFGWDVCGDGNDFFGRPGCKEGASMIERDGRYYFQYATPGTQYYSYCDVALTAPSPTGPFTRQKLNPFSIKPRGYVKGAGHGGTFKDLHGNWWHVTTCVVNGVDRRIVLFPVFFTSDGEMWCDTSGADWPIAVPGRRSSDPGEYRSRWMPLTYGKPVTVSSTAPGTAKSRLTDENMRFCWSAKTGNPGEWAQVDLGGTAEIFAVQIAFADTGDMDAWRSASAARRWRLEVTDDGKTWRTAVDESAAKNDADHCYRVLPEPVKASALRVVCEGVPDGALFALREIRAFGRMGGAAPSAPGRPVAVRDAQDRRRARISWNAAAGAEGYLLRYGPSPDKLHLSLLVRDACEAEIRSLDARQEYFWAVEAFNAAGGSPLSAVSR